MDELKRLRESGVIRLIDALVVQKGEDGGLTALQWSDLSIEEAEDMGATVGALIGIGLGGEASMEAGALAGMEAGADGHLIDESEVWDIAESIPQRERRGDSADRAPVGGTATQRSRAPEACRSATSGYILSTS